MDIATNNDDKDRPRLSVHPKFWPRHASDVTTVTDIQNLLNELGPVLVELNLLQP